MLGLSSSTPQYKNSAAPLCVFCIDHQLLRIQTFCLRPLSFSHDINIMHVTTFWKVSHFKTSWTQSTLGANDNQRASYNKVCLFDIKEPLFQQFVRISSGKSATVISN